MKKKLEAELISIAHRILKLKNRADIEQLQQETLKLYEKLSVLRFVEDNFSDVKPTIGYASAEQKLEDIYDIEETAPVHANEEEAKEDKARAEKATKGKNKTDDINGAKPADETKNTDAPEKNTDRQKQDKENNKGEGADTGEGGPAVSEEEKAITEEQGDAKEPEVAAETSKEESAPEEPEVKVQVEKPKEDIAAMEKSAAAVFEKEQESSDEEEDKAIDAEVVTIAPDENAKVEDSGAKIDFAVEREPAPETPKQKQKEISFEDFHNYVEPEFVRKDEVNKPKEEPMAEDKKTDEPAPAVKDWRDWEPTPSATDKKEEPKQEEKAEEPKAAEPAPVKDWRDWEPSTSSAAAKKEEPRPEVKKSLNDSAGKTINLGLNDRIAFEKHLFGGSSEDLNRVLSQLNTLNTFTEARNFIEDLVKPDYNNWKNKEEYEERFLAIVEKKFE